MKPILKFETKIIKAARLGSQSCVPGILGEKILQNHLEFHLSEEDEIYEGYGKKINSYPYQPYNCYSRQLEDLEIKTAVLENDRLKAVFLPEFGGRLWELWDKKREKNLLYTNDIIQFGNLAVRNAWFSGGVEWNIGVIGHNPLTTDSLYAAKLTTDKGDPVLRMYEYERIRKVPYQMDFWLEEDSSFLNCRMRIVNESTQVVPMYWWSNIAVPEHENGRILVPANQAFTYADGTIFKTDIPFVNGIDVTDYKKIRRSVDYFFDIPENSPKFIANVNEEGDGMIQMSTKRLRSRKLFSWGNGQASNHWQEFLTNQAGRYIEIQAGLAKTQYGCLPMAPHTAWEWIERYGAVQIPKEEMEKSHEERSSWLTSRLLSENLGEEMEKILADTKAMARRRGELVMKGSGYGAFGKRTESTAHLEFCLETESLKTWATFFQEGILPTPDPMEQPDEFLVNSENVEEVKKLVEEKNDNNWYAHYHLGLGWFDREDYEKAEMEWLTSLKLAESPWVCHALGCLYLLTNRKEQAGEMIVKGIKMKPNEISYLKEGFKILTMAQENEKICECYQALDSAMQAVARIRFYYISALNNLGQAQLAFQLLEENGGLVMEDIREGEDSVAKLWQELNQKLYGEAAEVPYRYDFKSF